MERWRKWLRGAVWAAGTVVTSLLLALSAVQALTAVGLRQRLEHRLAEPPLHLPVDLSKPGTYSAEWRMPYYAQNGLEFELQVTPPFTDGAALLRSIDGFRGAASLLPPSLIPGVQEVAASDFTATSQDTVRRSSARGAYLPAVLLHGGGTRRLTFTVEQPAPALAGREQTLEVRPVMDPVSAIWPIYVAWALAAVAFLVAALMAIVLIRVRMRSRRRDPPTPL